MELIVFWFGFAIVVGVIANNRGRSGIGWFLFSIILSPLLGLILVLALGRPADKRGTAPRANVGDELTKLAALRDSGVLTDEEFEQQKASLLGPRRPTQAPKRSVCGNCGKPVSPYWRDRCNHCKARYSEHPPVPAPEKPVKQGGRTCNKCGQPQGAWWRLTCQNCGALTG